MEKHTVTFEEIENFFLTNYTEEKLTELFPHLAIEELWENINYKETDSNSISDYASETQHWDLINSDLLTVKPKKGQIKYKTRNGVFFPNTTKRMEDFADWVMRSYDEELYPWEKNAWEELGLGGDDDVDYNGSYIIFLAEIIQMYIILKHKQ